MPSKSTLGSKKIASLCQKYEEHTTPFSMIQDLYVEGTEKFALANECANYFIKDI